jgi:hypothetical protein
MGIYMCRKARNGLCICDEMNFELCKRCLDHLGAGSRWLPGWRQSDLGSIGYVLE